MEELFVFGYGCKLFRDDERAMDIDRGNHLIPWMGDARLMIDRYDGRGHLYDLAKYDAENVQVDPWGMTDTEKAMEAACDEERYLELHVDLAEQAIYEEEEWKRYYEAVGEDGYKAVGFSYDFNPGDGSGAALPYGYVPEPCEVFVPPAELNIPSGMVVPQTDKENAIIEKTANFIAEHGAQMEIMIKAKQKDNSQFDFMEHSHPLNVYFKHMVKMIKSGKYKPTLAPKPESTGRQDSSYEGDEEEDSPGYLHPSLMSSAKTSVAIKAVPKPVVRVHETPYGDLIKSVTRSLKQAPQQDQGDSRLTPPPLPPFMAGDMYGPSQKNLEVEPVAMSEDDRPHSDHDHVPHGRSDRNHKKHRQREVNMGPQIVPPAPDIQPIIDRMAMYVAKNGVDFETVVKSKNDTRFDFLHPWHVHYAYYDFRKRLHLEELEQEKSEQEDDDSKNSNKGVSFRLKSKEQDTATLEKRKAFDYESTDDETNGEGEESTDKSPQPKEEVKDTPVPQPVAKPNTQTLADLEKKQAEERIKDRLALAAREKLAQASKEKQMQAERKRKAAMFINLLKSGGQAGPATDDKIPNGDIESAGGSKPGSRPDTPVSVPSGRSSPTTNEAVSAPDGQLTTAPATTSLPKAYYGIPASKRRMRAPSPPPTSYGRQRRSRSRSPKRSQRLPSPSSNRWSDRPRSRSPRRYGSPKRSSGSPGRSYSRRSKSPSRRNDRPKRSRSKSPTLSRRSPSHSKSKKKKHKKSRSRSRSPSKKSKSKSSRREEESTKSKAKPHRTSEVNSSGDQKQNGRGSHKNGTAKRRVPESGDVASDSIPSPTESRAITPPNLPQVTHEKMSKVRAMLKESRKAILKEEGGVDIDL